jgi:hypothetical protein
MPLHHWVTGRNVFTLLVVLDGKEKSIQNLEPCARSVRGLLKKPKDLLSGQHQTNGVHLFLTPTTRLYDFAFRKSGSLCVIIVLSGPAASRC